MSSSGSRSSPAVETSGTSARAAYEHSILVVADQTATSPALERTLTERAHQTHARFTLLMPGGPTAPDRLHDAVAQLRSEGLKVRGRVGDSDPLVAVGETWNPRHFDEIIVSTFPTHSSRWLGIDLPQRIRRLTGALVSHAVSPAPAPIEPRSARALPVARS